jgi:hypothetical protein
MYASVDGLLYLHHHKEMKKTILITLCIMWSASSIGQTFNDCSPAYHDQFNKIRFNQGRYLITKRTADSLIAILDTELQNCIIGKEIGDYSLTGRSGTTYTRDSLQRKVVLFNFWQ